MEKADRKDILFNKCPKCLKEYDTESNLAPEKEGDLCVHCNLEALKQGNKCKCCEKEIRSTDRLWEL